MLKQNDFNILFKTIIRCLHAEAASSGVRDHLLRNHCTHIKPNLTIEECRVMKQLREGQSRMVLTVAKGVAMEVMDKQDYTDKALSLLADTNTYRILSKDPTNKL